MTIRRFLMFIQFGEIPNIHPARWRAMLRQLENTGGETLLKDSSFFLPADER